MQQVAQLNAVERLVLPRCLVPRPLASIMDEECVLEVDEALEAAASGGEWDRFKVGDIITFEAWDGLKRAITILGIHALRERPGGYVDGMVYNGQPHNLMVTFEELSKLRILQLDTMGLDDVAMYRRLLSLDAAIEEVAA